MDAPDLRALVASLDTKDASAGEEAWGQLRPHGAAVVPLLLEFYPRAKTWQGRTAMVFHAIRFARASEAAFQLGLAALGDRSHMVRYRACGLLAYALRQEAVPALGQLAAHKDQRTVADAAAALDAIAHRNHHFFVDRGHTGRSFWVVNESDRQAP